MVGLFKPKWTRGLGWLSMAFERLSSPWMLKAFKRALSFSFYWNFIAYLAILRSSTCAQLGGIALPLIYCSHFINLRMVLLNMLWKQIFSIVHFWTLLALKGPIPRLIKQVTYLFYLWRRSWSTKFAWEVSFLSQKEHLNNFSPSWVLKWTMRFPFSAKVSPQPGCSHLI